MLSIVLRVLTIVMNRSRRYSIQEVLLASESVSSRTRRDATCVRLTGIERIVNKVDHGGSYL